MSQVPKISVGPAQRPRNGFDCSESHIYSQPAGMLLPVWSKWLQPNDHVNIDVTSIVQAQTLQGRPFLGMKQNFAFYFVPARLMCSYSDAFFSGLNPKNTHTSSVIAKDVKKKLRAPSFNPYDVFMRFCNLPGFDGKVIDPSDVFGVDFHANSLIRDIVPLMEDSSDAAVLDDIASKSKPSYSSGITSSDFVVNGKFRPFGNYKFDKVVAGKNFKDALGYPLFASYARFCDMLGYGSMPIIGESVNVDAVTKDMFSYELNLYKFLAYQKIYQDHFLDTNYEYVDARAYNVDDLFDLNTGKFHLKVDSASSLARAVSVFSPRYVKYEKDELSNIHPSPLFVDDVSSTIRTFVGTSGELLNGSPMQSYNLGSSADSAVMSDRNGVFTTISAAQLRNLFAFDKMQQITSRAPKTYKAQMLAHYGVNVSSDLRESLYLGGFDKALEVSPVVATADGTAKDSSTNFGQQGSYIDNAQNGHVDFTSNDFGVMMCLSWFSPVSMYDTDGIDAFNAKFAREDYFVPEAEDLGMQPITLDRMLPPWIKFSNYRLPDMSGVVDKLLDSSPKAAQFRFGRGQALGRRIAPVDTSRVYGWQPRYSEYKSSYDKIHGEFRTGRSMSILTTHRPTLFSLLFGYYSNDYMSEYLSSVSNNPKDVESSYERMKRNSLNGIPASFLFVDPSCTNPVVEVAYDGTEKTDPFRITTHFSVGYISDMSVNGLPRL